MERLPRVQNEPRFSGNLSRTLRARVTSVTIWEAQKVTTSLGVLSVVLDIDDTVMVGPDVRTTQHGTWRW